eukprot:6201434-Pleurochrysis_carterae.AAC.1
MELHRRRLRASVIKGTMLVPRTAACMHPVDLSRSVHLPRASVRWSSTTSLHGVSLCCFHGRLRENLFCSLVRNALRKTRQSLGIDAHGEMILGPPTGNADNHKLYLGPVLLKLRLLPAEEKPCRAVGKASFR